MDIQTAFEYMGHGYRIRRAGWSEGRHIEFTTYLTSTKLSFEDIRANDWEVIIVGIVKDFPIIYSD